MSHPDSVFEIFLGLWVFVILLGFFCLCLGLRNLFILLGFLHMFGSLILFGSLKFTGFCVFWFV
jgi:hypothetical protein